MEAAPLVLPRDKKREDGMDGKKEGRQAYIYIGTHYREYKLRYLPTYLSPEDTGFSFLEG